MENEAFEEAVMMHKDSVYAYAAFMLRDTAEAQDVAQEALVRLWEHRGQVHWEGARCWLERTAHNLCIDRLRRRKVRSEVGDPERAIDGRPSAAPGPLRLAEASEMGRILQGALGELSEQDRAVVVLREVAGLPYEEIAEVLGLPLGTLKARLHRARERLRERLCRAGAGP